MLGYQTLINVLSANLRAPWLYLFTRININHEILQDQITDESPFPRASIVAMTATKGCQSLDPGSTELLGSIDSSLGRRACMPTVIPAEVALRLTSLIFNFLRSSSNAKVQQ